MVILHYIAEAERHSALFAHFQLMFQSRKPRRIKVTLFSNIRCLAALTVVLHDP